MKKKLLYEIRCALLSLSLLNPSMIVMAKEKNEKVETEDKVKDAMNRLVNWCEKVDELVNEKVVDPVEDKLGELPLYKEESLWYITNLETKESFFIDKNTPTWQSTIFLDNEGNTVSKNAATARYRKEKEMYISITDLEETFLIITIMDYQEKYCSVNYTDKKETINEKTKYLRETNMENVIPSDLRKEKYSANELKEILNIVSEKEETFKLKK